MKIKWQDAQGLSGVITVSGPDEAVKLMLALHDFGVTTEIID